MTNFKNNILSILLLFSLISFTEVKAQLNGTYTIGTSGNTDYSSFTEAVNDLNSFGVSGKVIFEVENGTYIEHFNLGEIVGASETNYIKFEDKFEHDYIHPKIQVAEWQNLTMTSKYVRFEHIDFESSPDDDWNTVPLIRIDGEAIIDFYDCAFTTDQPRNLIDIRGVGEDNYIPIINIDYCKFNGGNHGIYAYGLFDQNTSSLDFVDKGIILEDTKLINQKYGAFYTNMPYPVQIVDNYMYTWHSNIHKYNSIRINNAKGCVITQNEINVYDETKEAAIFITNTVNAEIVNNMVDVRTFSLFIEDSPNFTIEFNSFRSETSWWDGSTVYLDVFFDGLGINQFKFRNNIVVCNNNRETLNVNIPLHVWDAKIDYNLLYNEGEVLARVINEEGNDIIAHDIDEWQSKTNYGGNSISVEPVFRVRSLFPDQTITPTSITFLYLMENLNPDIEYAGYLFCCGSLQKTDITGFRFRPINATIGAHELNWENEDPNENIRKKKKPNRNFNLSLIKNENLNIYPNPVKDHFKISFTLEESGPVSLKLFDLSGKLVLEREEEIMEKGNVEINITKLPNKINSKMLFVHVYVNNKIYKEKLYIQK